MSSFFGRRDQTSPRTYNESVAAFWKWFEDVAPRFYATIEAGKCASLGKETSTKIDELFSGFAWVYGSGANGKGHSLTLSGEGNIHWQLLALQWLATAPTIEGWTFYAARQPGSIRGHVIEVHGLRFDPKEIWVTPRIDEQAEKIDLTIWHPSWETLEDRQKYAVTFLFLDEALGEYGTSWWIGEINHGKDQLSRSFPLQELADYVAVQSGEKGWKKFPPGERWTLYSIKDVEGDFPRSDIFTLSTAVPQLFTEYMDANGEIPDPLKGSGADYIYISIAKDFFPIGEEVAKRGQIEDALEAALSPIHAGRIVGGAFGSQYGYIDLLVFNGERSLAVIQNTLRAQKVPAGTMIEFFAREKRGQRIAV